MVSKREKIKIGVFGDSISEGIGSKKNNYCLYLKSLLSNYYETVTIMNYSLTGTTIHYILDNIEDEWINSYYDVIIIAYGNVDAMLRPDISGKINLYSYLPKRYQKNGMLNPRPYFSNRWHKSMIQHLDSWGRWHLNRILLCIQGRTTWVSVDEFRKKYGMTIERLRPHTKAFILLSTVRVEERYFPGTNESYQCFNHVIKQLAEQESQTLFINLYHDLVGKEYFYHDLFHPSEKGYKEIANTLAEKIIDLHTGNGRKIYGL